MASVADWSTTAASNTSVGGISTDGNVMLVNQVDNMIRGLMAEVATSRDDGTIIKAPVLKAIKRITTSQTYTTPTSGVYALWIRAVGAGGAGGGGNTPAGTASPGGGGGGGAYGEVYTTSPAASYVIAIGAGGTGVSGVAGNNGGSTTVGSVLNLGGGTGGSISGAATNPQYQGGGVGGAVTTGGDRSYAGEMGDPGLRIDANVRTAGKGGATPFGVSGSAPTANTSATNLAGAAGVGKGSGGTGGISNTTTATAGGAGADGYVEIWEFV